LLRQPRQKAGSWKLVVGGFLGFPRTHEGADELALYFRCYGVNIDAFGIKKRSRIFELVNASRFDLN
jgi:hypothetical protein